MFFSKTKIDDLVIIKPEIIEDERGFFAETLRLDLLEKFTSHKLEFCQQNTSSSRKGVFRGLHFQTYPYAQTKLISVSKGEILDFAVDLRPNSKTFGKSIKVLLNDSNNYQFLVPKGFAHGFLVLSETARVNYQVDNYYNSNHEYGINAFDKSLNLNIISNNIDIISSHRDKNLPYLKDCQTFKF